MSTCPNNTIDSNVTGLRFAMERCLRELWPTPTWKALEPNSYTDFGQQITTVARNPINPARSRKKGTVTDMDASGGFAHDLTQDENLLELTQSFFYANARERGTTKSLVTGDAPVTDVAVVDNTPNPDTYEYTFANQRIASAAVVAGGTGYKVGDLLTVSGGTGAARAALVRVATVAAGAVTAVTVEDGGVYSAVPGSGAATTATSGSGSGCTLNPTGGDITTFSAGELVQAEGFGIVANNGVKTVVGFAAGVLEVEQAVADETPPAGASLRSVGYQFDADDVDVEMNGGLVRLTSSTVDFTTFNFLPGSWLFVGGDSAATRFANNTGFARISTVDVDYIEFDKVSWENAAAEDGTGISLQIFWGTVLRNETDPALILRKPVQLERTLGQDANGTMSEYLVGAMANEYTLNIAQASIVTVDMGFIACEADYRTGLQGLKAGNRPALPADIDAYNTTEDFSRIRLSAVDPVSANPIPLFEFCTDLTLTINNNGSANKAVGRLGAIGMTAGTFEVGGEVTAYFTGVAGPLAVRQNLDMTIDYILVKQNRGLLYDLPLLALGNGAVQVEQDQPITLPLETNAAESKFGHTLLMQYFPYLPDVAG